MVRLTTDDLMALARQVAVLAGEPTDFNRDEADATVRIVGDRLNAYPSELDAVLTLEVGVTLTAAVSTRPVVGSRSAGLFARLALETFLEHNGYLMVPLPGDTAALTAALHHLVHTQVATDVDLEAVRAWIVSGAVGDDGVCLRTRAGIDPSNQIRCFIGLPMTDPSDTELRRLGERSDEVADRLAGLGVACHQPFLKSNPRAAHLDAKTIRAIDESEVARSDLVVLLVERPTLGLGVVASLAERAGAVVVIAIADQVKISPMLQGVARAVFVPFDEQLPEALENLVTTRRAELEAAAGRRMERQSRWQRHLAQWRDELSKVRGDGVVLPPEVGLDRDRFRQLLSGAHHLTYATYDEIQAVRIALGAELFDPLTVDADAALLRAEARYRWPRQRSRRLAERARTILAAGGTRRLSFNNLATWKRLHDETPP